MELSIRRTVLAAGTCALLTVTTGIRAGIDPAPLPESMTGPILTVSTTESASTNTTKMSAERRQKVMHAYGKLPLSFIENRGQIDRAAAFYTHQPQQAIYFTPAAVHFTLVERRVSEGAGPRGHALRLSLLNVDPKVSIRALEQAETVVSYFRGSPDQWTSGVPTARGIEYVKPWPGIDLQYKGDNGRLESFFIVEPNADPGRIAMRYEGAEKIEIDVTGNLLIHTPIGTLIETAPVSYQEIDGERRAVESRFVLRDDQSITIALGDYEHERKVVIDPVFLGYGTFLGDSSGSVGYAIAVDQNGSAYVTGTTSAGFMTTPGAFDPTFNGGYTDIFIAKLNPAGSALEYATYLGGNGPTGFGVEEGRGIAVDASGNAYVTGTTFSTDFPVTVGAHDTTLGGDRDAFVTKINPSGTALVYSTYLGGSSLDGGLGIALDGAGNAYVVGYTQSSDFPALQIDNFPGASPGGGQDGFVAKLDASGSFLRYAAFLGGSGGEAANAIAVGPDGSAYVTGFTYSADFPVRGGFDHVLGLGDQKAFVVKVAYSGFYFEYSTLLGGSGATVGQGIAVDSAGNAYVTGWTWSLNFPVTVGAFATTFAGGYNDNFVSKINPSGSGLVYSTYLGGSGPEGGLFSRNSIAVDAGGNAWVTGDTQSNDFPVTADALRATLGGFQDAFVTELNPTGSALLYSSYLGGSGGDSGYGIALDSAGDAYLTGYTSSTDFPVTAGSYDTSLSGSGAFVVKLTGSTLQDQTEETITEAIAAINALGAGAFKNANNKNALANKLNAVLADIEAGLYADALSKLENDLLKKTDGCAVSGAPDATDWIKDCAAQAEIYAIIMDAIALLETLV